MGYEVLTLVAAGILVNEGYGWLGKQVYLFGFLPGAAVLCIWFAIGFYLSEIKKKGGDFDED